MAPNMPQNRSCRARNNQVFSFYTSVFGCICLRVKAYVLHEFLLLAALLLCAGGSPGQCVIEGKVTLPQAEPATVRLHRYPGQVGEIAPPDPPVAVVYLGAQFRSKAATSTPATNQVLQSGMQFRPALLPVQVGTPVAFPNADDFYHNVFSYSKPKRFDLGRYRKEDRPAPIIVFDKPGVVKLFCEIHQHMRGVILVLDTPYFTTTQTNGEYRLENLPGGNGVVKAWVDEKHEFEKPVSLEPGKPLRIDFDSK